MYWIGVLVMFILGLIYIIISAYKDKYLSLTTILCSGIILPFTSWAGIIVVSIVIIYIIVSWAFFEGLDITIWRKDD